MGEMYCAFDPKIGREVAVKVLSADVAANKERVARFEQEAQAAGALNHPNILAIHDVDSKDNVLYVVSELLEGDELRDRLNDGSLPLRKTIDYAQQIVSGGQNPVWAVNGKELFFIAPDGKLMSVDTASGSSFEPGKPKELFDIMGARTVQTGDYDVSVDGQRFVFISRTAEATSSLAVITNWIATLKK